MLLSLIFLLSISSVFPKPEQVVLSLTNDPAVYSVTWISLKPCKQLYVFAFTKSFPVKDTSYPFVQFGTSAKKLLTVCNATTTSSFQWAILDNILSEWTDQGIGKMVRYTFRAFLDGLQSGRRYCNVQMFIDIRQFRL